MKNKITLIYFLLTASVCFSQVQSAFDKALSDISSDLAEKLKVADKKKILVLYITDIDKQTLKAGKYLADVVAVNFVNSPIKFIVFTRSNLNEITDAKKLFAEGYVDAAKAKELGKILDVEVIVIGSYTLLSNTVKLSLQALSSDNGIIIAASMRDLPLNADAKALLGINTSIDEGNRRASNAPLNSDEQYNNPESINKECATQNTGDYCFVNSTKCKLYLEISSFSNTNHNGNIKNATLNPGQKQCFNNLLACEWTYTIHDVRASSPLDNRPEYYSGGSVIK